MKDELSKLAEDRAFNHGYLIAVTTMLHQHDCPVTAEDALRDAGFTWTKVKALGLDDFDLKLLRPVFRNMERRDRCDRARAEVSK
ncbi:MAG: hypothetical protein PWP11_3268 [Thauera sp.]|nr:hypothetical protein [Thauera sp.]MDI3491991.1 hypothetical protein [Thauera sp.]